ncbi:MAG: hypothetical protein WEH44_10165, partial [Pirellulaceae bacterium]
MSAFILTLLLSGLAAANADDAQTLSARILDDSLPAQERQSLIEKHPDLAAELVAAMTASLPTDDAKEEYRRIPWIWRVAVAAGKRNDETSLRGLLDVSLPRPGEKLRDWQAVVIGGGVINGISLAGQWPHERIGDLLASHEGLQKRWKQALSAAATMADDEQVKTGTRYDALRMIALDPTKESREQLTKYLGEGTDGELQMGAVSGLSDIDAQEIAPLLIGHIKHLSASNRTLAIDALLRSDA